MNPLPTLTIEKLYWDRGYSFVAGIDEAGRGCLAGPVVAAAVLFPPGLILPEVNDSKKLSIQKRYSLSKQIRASALSVGVGLCTPKEIDATNILRAALEAMKRAVADLEMPPDYLLVDGNTFVRDAPCPYETVVKGDSRSFTIAAASIIAKATRDAFMLELHKSFPQYGWNTNVGYPTKQHYAALKKHGLTPFHRRSFRLF